MSDCHRFSSSSCRFIFAALPVVLSALYVGWPTTIQAQQDRGSVAGTVTDSSKAALRGARVEIAPSAAASPANTTASPSGVIPNITFGSMNATTDQGGSFILSGLTPGHYTVKVSYIGFHLKPSGFFDGNPALDVAAPERACHTN